MGQIVEIYKGTFFTIPDEPTKNSVDNYKAHPKDQKWKLIERPENWDLMTKAAQDHHINMIDDYCTFGYWFFIKGVLTYITGDHFHYLNEFKLDIGYPDYRDADRRWFYHWEICEKDDECFGQIYGKKRRDGYTYRALSILLNHARKTFNANYGIMSKTGHDAKECFLKLKYSLEEYIDYLKPQEKTNSETRIIFDKPAQRITSKTVKVEKKLALNTTISWRNTKENSFDSMAIKRILCDEPAKWEEANVEVWYNKARKFLSKGMNITGKILFGSSVNESTKGGDKFEKIWKGSDRTERTKNNRTLSGMYRYFVPAYDGYEGCIDEYGASVIETPEIPIMGIDGVLIKKGAREYLQDESDAFKKAGDMVGYYEHKREFPFTENDMFIEPANRNASWELDCLYQQIEHNDMHVISNTLVYGYFNWLNGERDTVVEWNSVPYGDARAKHTYAWLPPVEDRNKFTKINGKKAPANSHIGLFSLDPYSAVKTIEKRGSKAASHGFKKYDIMATDTKLSDTFIGEYWNRLSDPLLVYEDMLMQSHFFGWGILPEKNVRTFNDYARNRDYNNYIIASPEMSMNDYIENIGKDEDGGVSTNKKTQQQYVEYAASYIKNKIGINSVTGKMGYMPFNNTLKDLVAFDITHWTPYDLSVSFMLCILGSRGISQLKPKEGRNIDFFQQYNNAGRVSVRNK